MRESVSQRERERKRESKIPILKLSSISRLFSETNHGPRWLQQAQGQAQAQVCLAQEPDLISIDCMLRKVLLISRSVAVDRWPWRQEGADLLQHGVAELAELRFQTSSRRSVRSLSLSLSQMVISMCLSGQQGKRQGRD